MEFTAKSNKQLIHDIQSEVDTLNGLTGIAMDDTPIESSTQAISSAGVYNALQAKQDLLDSDSVIAAKEITVGTMNMTSEWHGSGLKTTSGGLTFYAKSGTLKLQALNILYDVDTFGTHKKFKVDDRFKTRQHFNWSFFTSKQYYWIRNLLKL